MNTYVGQQLEQYKIEAHIGNGSSGTVYRATDLNLERQVVLKLLKPGLTKHTVRQQQILLAAQAASRLTHPAIVPLYNFGQQNGQLYLVTAHVDGISLERALGLLAQGERVLRLDETLHIIAQIADGLGYAHQSGVLHGDLKPGNILIKPLERPLRTGDPTLKAMLTDFGLSPIPDSGIPEGLPPELARPLRRFVPYLAPERQVGQPVDGRSDIYSLGVILYQLVAGQLPNRQQPLREVQPGLPTEIANIVTKAIAYSLADRYQMAEQMGDDLRRAASRLTAADNMLFAPQATVIDIGALIEEDKHTPPVRPPLAALAETAVRPQPLPPPPPAGNVDEEATPSLLSPDGHLPPQKNGQVAPANGALQTSPPPAIGDQIIITGQGRSPRHFGMTKSQITIGRAPNNDIVLSSLDVSRHHARLERVAGSWRMVDVNSKGGTFYDGRKLSPQQPTLWQPNQKLQIGPYFLQWQLAGDVEAMPDPPTPGEPITELFQVSAEGSQVEASHSNFSVALNPTQATLAPGGQAHLQIDLFNQSSQVLVVKMSLTGLPAVATLAQDTVSMTPGARATVPLTLQLPLGEQPLLAGQHPFQLLLHTEGPPVETAVLEGQLTILPEELFELSIWPMHVEDGGTCRVMVRNEGNLSSTVQVSALDPAGKLQFFGDEQPLKLEPGSTGTTAYRITHRRKRPFFGRIQQIPFEVEIRTAHGLRQNKLGHLELHPRFPAWVLPLVQLLLVLLLIAVVINSVMGNRQNPVENLPVATPVLGDNTLEPPPLTAAQLAGDDDNDGLTGDREIVLGSDPFNEDTDGDGLLDGFEVNTYGTDPLRPDTDGDGLTDLAEIEQYSTDPTLADTDLDGASDGQEVANGTDPLQFQLGGGTAVTQTSPPAEDHANHDSVVPPAATLSPPVTLPPSDNEVTVEILLADEQSGWLTAAGDVTLGAGEWPQAGDLVDGTAVRALLTFPLQNIPSDATIRTAFLRFSEEQTLEGTPFDALGCLQFDFVEISPPADETAYDAPGFFIACELNPPSSIDVTFDVEDALIQGQNRLTLRLAFETDSNGDAVADLYVIRTAPTLEITYLLP
ncbi:MAG: protein kinase [Ardenticatenaceae bacterium]|nr:protein kinase [Anaerolineales bacterium]MCB8938962.1 protein kinase [Ardenticatenaceae bacterium]MCB8974718.1 protein kinase [Ardenticatenaceae bacterium]